MKDNAQKPKHRKHTEDYSAKTHSIREEHNEKYNDVLVGRNCVREALKSGRTIDSIIIAKGNKNGSLGEIITLAKNKGIPVKEADSKKLDFLSKNGVHQGIIAMVACKEYVNIDDIFKTAEERSENPFIIILDEIEDPHNLGAIIRTAECTGVHGIIIPKRRSVGLSYAVGKSSAGAVEYVNVARVTNLSATIEELKQRGVWVLGADMDGIPSQQFDLKGSIAIVIGNEGKGIGRLIRSKCDGIVSLPMKGNINSLNASVAAGILMYDVCRQRI